MWGLIRFYKESRKFTKGWSNYKYWSHFPRALIIFYYLCVYNYIRKRVYKWE